MELSKLKQRQKYSPQQLANLAALLTKVAARMKRDQIAKLTQKKEQNPNQEAKNISE